MDQLLTLHCPLFMELVVGVLLAVDPSETAQDDTNQQNDAPTTATTTTPEDLSMVIQDLMEHGAGSLSLSTIGAAGVDSALPPVHGVGCWGSSSKNASSGPCMSMVTYCGKAQMS